MWVWMYGLLYSSRTSMIDLMAIDHVSRCNDMLPVRPSGGGSCLSDKYYAGLKNLSGVNALAYSTMSLAKKLKFFIIAQQEGG
jgi:hypothetical protein